MRRAGAPDGPGFVRAVVLGGVALAMPVLTGCDGFFPAPAVVSLPRVSLRPVRAKPASVKGTLPKDARLLETTGHLFEVTCVSFSTDGRRLVSGDESGRLVVWDVSSGKVTHTLDTAQKSSVCRFLPDDRVLSVGNTADTIWDPTTGESRTTDQFARITNHPMDLAVSPSGREYLVYSFDGDVVAYSIDTGKPVFRSDVFRSKEQSWRGYVGYLDDGSRFGGNQEHGFVWGATQREFEAPDALASGPLGGDRLLLVTSRSLDIAQPGKSTRSLIRYDSSFAIPLTAATSARKDVALTGHYASESTPGGLIAWDLLARRARCQFPSHKSIEAATFTIRGDQFAWGSDDGTVHIARMQDCNDPSAPLAARRLGGGRRAIVSVALDENSLALAGDSGEVSAWSRDTLEMTGISPSPHSIYTIEMTRGRRLVNHATGVSTLSADGLETSLINISDARASSDGVLFGTNGYPDRFLVRLSSGSDEPTQVFRSPTQEIGVFAISPDGSKAVVDTGKGEIYQVPLRSGAGAPSRWPRSPSSRILTIERDSRALEFDPTGTWVAQAIAVGPIVLRRAKDGAIQREFNYDRDPGVPGNCSLGTQSVRLTAQHVWACGGRMNRQLLRWSLTRGGPDPDLVIDEGAGISSLAVSKDGAQIVTALTDGRAAIRSLPDGALIAHLIPLQDGNWATLRADGRFSASIGTDASTAYRHPTSGCSMNLDGAEVCIALNPPSVSAGSRCVNIIRTTVFSPSGPPKVTLDGRSIRSVRQSATVADSYDVELYVDDCRPARHTLTATTGSYVSSATVDTAPSPQYGAIAPRALVIGNATYEHLKPIPSAKIDSDAMVKALRANWGLRDLQPRELSSSTLKPEVARFLQQGRPGETLLLYFAGHGTAVGTQGYLLPVDYRPGEEKAALSAAELTKMVRESKATRILLVLDACRAGSFQAPTETFGHEVHQLSGSPLERQKFVGLLASSAPDTNAEGSASGGVFTQALVRAMSDPTSVDPVSGAVTVQRAFRAALDSAGRQNPRIFGNLDALPLAFPSGGAKRNVATVADGSPSLKSVTASVVGTRQVSVVEHRPIDGGEQLQINLVFGHAAESVQIGIYPYAERGGAPRPQLFHERGAAEGEQVDIYVPISSLATRRKYRVEVQPCKTKQSCEDEPVEEFTLDL